MHRLIPYFLILLVMMSVICQAQSIYQAEDADVIYNGIIESEHEIMFPVYPGTSDNHGLPFCPASSD